MMTDHKFNWTRVEDLILMDMKKAGMTHKDIGTAINRTAKAVECRWRELRRGMGKRTSGNKIMTSTYTADDIALAKSLERKGRYQWEIANILGRSESSVGNMLYRMRGQNND